MSIRGSGKNSGKAVAHAQQRILEIESRISTTKPESEVYRINHSQNFPVEISEDTKKLAEFSIYVAKKTNGALNPCLFPITSAWGFTTENFRVPSDSEIEKLLSFTDFSKVRIEPAESEKEKNARLSLAEGMMLDFGAVGKGFAGDEAVRILKSFGIESAVLDLGGNIQVLGSKKGSDGKETEWNIGIKSPWGGSPVGGVKVKDRCVVTSGGYERYFEDENGRKYIHIFDGKTGRPVESDIAAVTIIAESGLHGDALSTAMFVLGKNEAMEYWKANPDFEMILIVDKDTIAFTEGLSKTFKLMAPFRNVEIISR